MPTGKKDTQWFGSALWNWHVPLNHFQCTYNPGDINTSTGTWLHVQVLVRLYSCYKDAVSTGRLIFTEECREWQRASWQRAKTSHWACVGQLFFLQGKPSLKQTKEIVKIILNSWFRLNTNKLQNNKKKNKWITCPSRFNLVLFCNITPWWFIFDQLYIFLLVIVIILINN